MSSGLGSYRRTIALGAAIMWRTGLGLWLRGAALALIIGAISSGVRIREGATQAILFIAVLVPMLLFDTLRRVRGAIGKQHEYLLLQQPAIDASLWRALVAGEVGVAGAMGLGYYCLAVAFHWRFAAAGTLLLFALPACEIAVWLAALAHLFGDPAPGVLASSAFFAASGLVVAALIAKMLLTYPVSFALGALISVVSIAGAPYAAGHAPYAWQGSRTRALSER